MQLAVISMGRSQIDWASYEKLKRMQARRRRRTERALYRDKHPIALTWVRKWKSAFIQRKQQSAEH